MTLPTLTALDLGLAASLLIINAAISLGLQLRLERSLAIAAVRMVVQLSLVGLILRIIFSESLALVTISAALVMIAVATIEVASQRKL